MDGLVIKGLLRIQFFLSKLTHGDTVMADRGFNIGEMLDSVGGRLEYLLLQKAKPTTCILEVEKENSTYCKC